MPCSIFIYSGTGYFLVLEYYKVTYMKRILKSKIFFDRVVKALLILVFIVLLLIAINYMMNIRNVQSTTNEFFSNGGDTYDVVLVHSDSCGHCRKFMPTYDKVSQLVISNAKYSDKVNMKKVEASSLEAKPYVSKVDGFPTVLLMQGDRVVQALVGNQTEEKLMAFIDQNVL
jgi:thiol-disulfide isomerase/thioredoxin